MVIFISLSSVLFYSFQRNESKFMIHIENKTSEIITEPEILIVNNTTNSENDDHYLQEIGEDVKFDNNTGVYYHTHDPSKIYDDFSAERYNLNLGELSPNGKWLGKWNGGGSLEVKQDIANNKNNVLMVESGFVVNDTRSGLVLSSNEYENFKLSLDVRNDKQLRETEPNPWEVGWVFWRYVDNTHFYYFTLKPNGSESGKYDGGINPTDQLFLESTEFPNSAIGKWDHFDILVKKDHITILVNGKIVQDFVDTSSFSKGKIGFYCEDASVSFDNISIIPLEV